MPPPPSLWGGDPRKTGTEVRKIRNEEKNGISISDSISDEDRDTTIDFGASAFPVIKMHVTASSGDNVKPGLLMQALSDMNGGGEIGDTDLMVIREDLYDETGKSLIDAGERF